VTACTPGSAERSVTSMGRLYLTFYCSRSFGSGPSGVISYVREDDVDGRARVTTDEG